MRNHLPLHPFVRMMLLVNTLQVPSRTMMLHLVKMPLLMLLLTGLLFFFFFSNFISPCITNKDFFFCDPPSPSNNVIGVINFVAMLISIPIIEAGIWLSNEQDNSCVKLLQGPVIILGILILVVALAGFVGGIWRIPWLLNFYHVAMLILIILLACLVVFIYMVTIRGSGQLVDGRSYLENHLDDFSRFLHRRVRSPLNWDRIMNCLSSTTITTRKTSLLRRVFGSPLYMRSIAAFYMPATIILVFCGILQRWANNPPQ